MRRVVRDPSISEEVAHDVMLEVWRAAGRFDPERGSAHAWMATMARRRAVDCVRSVAAQRRRDHAWSHAATGHHGDLVADHAVVFAERDAVRAALAGLTALERQSVELAYFEGLTYREVAERLGIPLATVKSRIRAGLQRLRASLQAEAA